MVDAVGVVYVSVSVWVFPASHAIHPGRLMTTRTFNVSLAGTGCLATIAEPTTLTGTSFCSRPPITETETILPPPSGIPTFAMPLASVSRLALADTNTSARHTEDGDGDDQ